MAYEATIDRLIEDFQTYLDSDPVLWDQSEGCLTWSGQVVAFTKTENFITVDYQGERITFCRP